MYKVFQQDVFDMYDNPARLKAKEFWERLGYSAQDNPDDFAEDLLVTGKGKKFFCEVEVKRGWHGATFNFNTLHIPARKAKFLTKAIKFMVFNNSLTHAALVGHREVANAPVVVVENQFIKQGERFFDIPVKDVLFVTTLQ